MTSTQEIVCTMVATRAITRPLAAAPGDYVIVVLFNEQPSIMVLEPMRLKLTNRLDTTSDDTWRELDAVVAAGDLFLVDRAARPFLTHLVRTGQLSIAQAVASRLTEDGRSCREPLWRRLAATRRFGAERALAGHRAA